MDLKPHSSVSTTRLALYAMLVLGSLFCSAAQSADQIPILSEIVTNLVISSSGISGHICETQNGFTCEIGDKRGKSITRLATHDAFELTFGKHARLMRKDLEVQILSVSPSISGEVSTETNLCQLELSDIALRWPSSSGYLLQRKVWVADRTAPITERFFITWTAGLSKSEKEYLRSRIRRQLSVEVMEVGNVLASGCDIPISGKRP